MRLLLFNLATDADDPILGFTTRWIAALAEHVESIDVITMRAGKIEVPKNVRVYSVGKEKGYSEPRRAIEFYRLLGKLLFCQQYDACFAHMMPLFAVMAAPVIRLKKIPTVLWYAHKSVTPLLRLATVCVDRVVASSKEGFRIHSRKFQAIGQGIDTKVFRSSNNQREEPPLLLYVGRISPIKDLLTLIEAIQLLRDSGYEVRCAIVGEPPDRDRSYGESIRAKVRSLGLENQVMFAGSVPNYQLVDWYHRCFAHVNCSPSEHSLDKTVLEAMACGKPSLSSTLGFKDTMGCWADHLLFEQENPADLVEKIKQLLQMSQEERELMADDLRQLVMEGHSLQGLAKKLTDVFEKIGRQRGE